MTAPDLSPAEAEIVARFDAAPTLPESYRPSSPVALLDQLDELRAKATPGPWRQDDEFPQWFGTGESTYIGTAPSGDNAAVIVGAVNAVGPLVDAVRDALSVVDRDARFCPDCRQGIDDTHSRVRTAITAALSVTP